MLQNQKPEIFINIPEAMKTTQICISLVKVYKNWIFFTFLYVTRVLYIFEFLNYP